MSAFSWPGLSGVSLAQASPDMLTVREWDWPESPLTWLALLGGSLLVVGWVVALYRRDTRRLSPAWCVWLVALRLAVWGALLAVFLNPQERTQEMSFRPSRVALLVDTSLSMRHPQASRPPSGAPTPSRAEAVRQLLADSPVLETLRQQHEVSLYTFDTALAGPVHTWPYVRPEARPSAEASTPAKAVSQVNWEEVLQPRGLETRLGESLNDLMRQVTGRTLSGIVVITDGNSNAGIDAASTHDRAVATKTRLVTIGLGSTEAPVNLQLVDLQSPTDVQLGDPFDITAFVQGQGLAGKTVRLELLAQPADGTGEPAVIETRDERLLEDNVPVEVKFARNPSEASVTRYSVRATPVGDVAEVNPDDNAQSVVVNATDRPTRVLLLAGGPMRDYQFVRNLLFRHKAIDVDVYLQTGEVGTSQESDQLLLEFPKTREELFGYDCIIAFDPEWQRVPQEQIQLLYDWVYQEAGGLILVAGDVNTLQLAAVTGGTGATDSTGAQFEKLRELYPVVLNSYLSDLRFDRESSQPWPLNFLPEGKDAGFLQLTDDPVTSLSRWQEFPGFYRCYPTQGAKAGATVYAKFSDPRASDNILMASQFFGQGRVFYLGSAEMWRLRAVGDEDYDRFWIKTLRETSQGRLRRGTKRGLLLPENRRLTLGQTARLRARLLDSQFQPYGGETVALSVLDPKGRPLLPSRTLVRDGNRPGEFVGEFRVSQPGIYKLAVAVPESQDQLTDEIAVAIPRLEDENIRQNTQLLGDLVRDTGGATLSLADAAVKLPELLPARGEPILIDQRLRTLWDRGWVMYLVVGLLSAEWLTRKLLKLS